MEHPTTPPSPWLTLARSLPEATMAAFFERFGHGIDISVDVVETADGGRTPKFGFRMAKTGLLPTAIESAWFEAYVLAYRHCCNRVLDMLDAAADEDRH